VDPPFPGAMGVGRTGANAVRTGTRIVRNGARIVRNGARSVQNGAPTGGRTVRNGVQRDSGKGVRANAMAAGVAPTAGGALRSARTVPALAGRAGDGPQRNPGRRNRPRRLLRSVRTPHLPRPACTRNPSLL